MSTEWRALCRAVGQLGLLVFAAPKLYSMITMVTWCLPSGTCAGLGHSLASAVLPIVTAIALLGWWATCRQHRRVLAQVCAGLIIAYLLEWPIYGLLTSEGTESLTALVASALTYALMTIGPMLLLLLSYRGRDQLQLDEPSRPSWIWLVLVPLVALRAVYLVLPDRAQIPAVVLWLAVAGGLYGVLRRSRPVPGAASWLPASLALTALALPDATLTRWSVPDQVWGESVWPATIDWLTATVVVGAFAAAQWVRARRGRVGPPAARTHPADAT